MTSVFETLRDNPDKPWRFNHAEIFFFSKWWELQLEQTKDEFRQLVRDGKWEFVNGGWVASDEACPLYSDLVENIKVGHEFLWAEFGITPQVAWHADAFGHSSETANLFKQLGYEGLFFGRMSDDKKEKDLLVKDLHFMWSPAFEGPAGAYESSEGLYSHLTFRSYLAPCDIEMGSPYNKDPVSIVR